MKRKACIIGRAGRLAALLLLLLIPLPLMAQHAPFAIVGDTHIGWPGTLYPAFIKLIEEEGIDVIIHTGDAIQRPGDLSEWQAFLDMTGTGKTLHLTPGNHDVNGEASQATYLQFFDAPYSSFSEGDTLFLLLDTEMPGEQSRIAGEQLAWVEAELTRPFRYKFVFLHEPLYPFIPHHGLDRHKAARDALHRLFVRSGVSLVVAGHDHVYDRRAHDGITYVIDGRCGGRSWLSTNGHSYRYIVARRTGDAYTFQVRDMPGKVWDEFTVSRPSLAVPEDREDLDERTPEPAAAVREGPPAGAAP